MAKKGQTFNRYTPQVKMETVRLHMVEGLSLRSIRERLGIRSDVQICEWVKRYQ
ncbi:hypothetical protein GCM10011571_16770 [Marinithermofilum abyssi]|uniref:Transposase n=1 Tax=Marinithermofilum abyssi TaxID=1571185 RepID=A0A8J2VCT9_9BACL|nr:hypothetical protein GCM10011571_16770 [Marinithermofilum abyssi]